jgi:integrase
VGRKSLPVGTPGNITVTPVRSGGYRARCRFRDADGVTRQPEAWGKTKTEARNKLHAALKDRKRTSSEKDIGPDSYVRDVVALWWAQLERKVEAGKRSPGTARTYKVYVDSLVVPRLGNLRVREVTVGRVDDVLQVAAKAKGSAAAKTTRAIISSVMSLAARHDAIDANPTREAEEIETPNASPARALTLDEVAMMRGKIRHDRRSRERDLPDLVDMMLATGLRIGEVCAITWDSLDLANRTVEVRGVVIRVTGKGLIIKTHPTNKTKHRTLTLPRWAVAMLLNRQLTRKDNEWDVVFTSPRGFLRDPSNTNADLKEILMKEIMDDSGQVLFPSMPQVTSHVLGRKTVLTLMNLAGLPASAAADQAGHAKVSMTQDRYFARRTMDTGAADVLDAAFGPSESV